MKIITIGHKGGNEFVSIVVNEDDAQSKLKALRKADKGERFDITLSLTDSFQDGLDYIKRENR